MLSLFDGMNTNLVIGVLSFLGVFLTAVFTFIYQRKSAKETALNKFIDSAFQQNEKLLDRVTKNEEKLAAQIAKNDHNEYEIERLRDANHKLRGDMQTLQSQNDLRIQEATEKHKAEKEAYERQIAELRKRVEELERMLRQYEQTKKH